VAAGLAFPHAAQAIQIVRRRKLPGKKKWSRETVYAITSLTAVQASPAELAAIIRGHWMIEDRLHWVRDMDLDEDRSQIRTGSGPRVMASLRNLVLTILRLAGAISIAAACAITPAGPALANDHELLNDFAEALGGCLGADQPVPDDLCPGELGQVGAAVAVAEYPAVLPGLVVPAEVPAGDPGLRLVGVAVAGPHVGEPPHVDIQAREDPG
jgi:predicted transposase YbfD/YdcC